MQEKTLKREPLSRLWAEHAAQARESGRLAHEAMQKGQGVEPAERDDEVARVAHVGKQGPNE